MTDVTRNYGWVKNKDDPRDIVYSLPPRPRLLPATATATPTPSALLPPKFDLRDHYRFPEVYDQGTLGSCTANAIACVYQLDEIRQGNRSSFMPSRLFIYYNERDMEGTVERDCGAQIRDGIKSINRVGVCEERLWDYVADRFATRPTAECYREAELCRSVEYRTVVQDLAHLKTALVDGYPVVFGFTVYERFEGEEIAEDGVCHLPREGERQAGGHAVVLVGYDDTAEVDGERGAFIVRNSWGSRWGKQGHFVMPYRYVCDPALASDFWVVTMVSDPDLTPGDGDDDTDLRILAPRGVCPGICTIL